jgi:dihydropteroate synthase
MSTPFLPDPGHHRALVMGILNTTPDSFSDGGLFAARDAALLHAAAMVAEGADIIDVGGESTRPGAEPVGVEAEIERVVPIVAALVEAHPVPVSIDTYKAATAGAALAAGATVVNDVWGLQRDPEIAVVAADRGARVVVMHNRAEIDGSLDVLDDMKRWFDRSLAIARRAGIADDRIALDPGIGFGKSFEQNLDALRRLPELKALGFPVLVGLSRKSMIGRLTGVAEPRDRLAGTIAADALALWLGADIIRVHDVRPHVEAARLVAALRERHP